MSQATSITILVSSGRARARGGGSRWTLLPSWIAAYVWAPLGLTLAVAYLAAADQLARAIGQRVELLIHEAVSSALEMAMLAYVVVLGARLASRLRPAWAAGRVVAALLDRPRFHFELAVAIAAMAVAAVAFSNLKQMLPLLNERLYDSELWRLDERLHAGLTPAPRLNAWAGELGILPAMDAFAPLLTGLACVLPILFLVMPSLRPERGRMLVAVVLVWILCSAASLLWPSLGPAYYRANQFPWLAAAPLARDQQQTRLEHYVAYRTGAGPRSVRGGGGIASLAVVEVGVPALLAVGAWRRRRLLSLGFWAVAAGVLATDLSLGWDHAVSGYAAMMIAVASWDAAGLAVGALPPEAAGSASQPAQGRRRSVAAVTRRIVVARVGARPRGVRGRRELSATRGVGF